METQRIINEEFERLKMEIENMRLKNKLYFERSKRLQETNDEKYNQFQHGVSWGHLRCLQLVTAWVRLARKKILRQMEGNALPKSTSILVTTERITDSTQVSNPDDPGFNYTKDTGKYLDECIKSATKSWKGVDVDKFMDEVRGRDDEEAKALLYVNDKAYQKGLKDGKAEAMKDIPKWKAVGYDNDEQEYPLCLTRYADVNGDYHYSFSSGKILENLEYVSIANLERLPKDETD